MLSAPEMSTKMKGLLKGLRYISQIFDTKEEDEEEEEEEMQIGFPTDVKHVAHIGWDGPSVTSPSWMNDFRETPESASAPLDSKGGEAKETSAQKSSSQDSSHPSGGGDSVGIHESPAREMPELPKPSRRRRQSSGAQSFDATTQDAPLDIPTKQSSRRQKPSSSGLTINSPAKEDETSFEGVKPSKKSPKEPREDLPCIPKQTRRKKTKGSTSGSGGGSTRSRPKTSLTTSTYTSPFSDPGTGSSASLDNNINEAYCPTSALKGLQLGENGCDTSSVSVYLEAKNKKTSSFV